MKTLSLLITSVALLISCEKSAQSMTNTDTTTTKTADGTAANATPAATVNTDASKATSGKPALNPAHGEPYHRCDIAVGAPIDSQPEQPAAPQMVAPQGSASNGFNTNPIAAPSVAAPQSAPQATGPKPALNPAHGLPHHRCDIEVGAPLT